MVLDAAAGEGIDGIIWAETTVSGPERRTVWIASADSGPSAPGDWARRETPPGAAVRDWRRTHLLYSGGGAQ